MQAIQVALKYALGELNLTLIWIVQTLGLKIKQVKVVGATMMVLVRMVIFV
jgi:hypothetical protein